MKKVFSKIIFLTFLILPIYLTFFANNNQVKSAPVTNLKNTLSSAQLSFFGRIANFSSSVFTIYTTSANPSQITGNLFTGDTLAIADVGRSAAIFIVKDINNTATVTLTGSIGTTTTNNGNSYVVATRSAIHTITFTPQAASNGEIWQFLIKASDRVGETINDGMPDQGGFDIGSTIPGGSTTGLGTRLLAADVTCPTNSTASVGTTGVSISSGVGASSLGLYHLIQCAYNAGTSNPGTGGTLTVVIGRSLATGSQLINPAPALNHTVGQANSSADTYTFAVRQLDSGSNILDTTFGKLAVTESVRVTAIVDPTITFYIGTTNSTSAGTTRCGSPISASATNTTPTSVAFGALVLSTYNNLSQSLHCVTNSSNGYVIQAYENKPMTMIGTTAAGGVAITIPDTNCPGGACTTTTQSAWTTYTTSGFGYSLEVGTTTGAAVSIGITTTGHYKPFGIGSANAQTLLSRTNTPSDYDWIYICYRAVAGTSQQAGTYENSISFIATATF